MVDIDCNLLRRTEKGMLIEYHQQEIWLPRSQIKVEQRYVTGNPNAITVSIPSWLAKDKNIIE